MLVGRRHTAEGLDPSLLLMAKIKRYIRDFALFNVCSSFKNCPSARCASAANVVCRDVDVFAARNVLLSRFYNVIIIIIIIWMLCDYTNE
jgi:hypothetical protein